MTRHEVILNPSRLMKAFRFKCLRDFIIPSKSDPRWKMLVTGNETFALKGLAVRMVLTRVRLMGARRNENSLQDAIDTAYDFFSKNLEAARDDIQTLFGGRE